MALVTPGATASALLGRTWESLATNVWLGRFRRGLVPVGLGLMAGGVLVVGRMTIKSWPLVLAALVVTVAVNRKCGASSARCRRGGGGWRSLPSLSWDHHGSSRPRADGSLRFRDANSRQRADCSIAP